MREESKEPLPLSGNLHLYNKRSNQSWPNLSSPGMTAFSPFPQPELNKKRKCSHRILSIKNIRKIKLSKLKITHQKDSALVDKLFGSVVFNTKVRKLSTIL